MENHLGEGQKPPTSHSPAFNLTRRLVARRLFRVHPCLEGTIHLQTSMSSPGFEPRLYGTVISVANYHTGWATKNCNLSFLRPLFNS
ncbi:hypothetical protein TNCV_2992121 [Trichonephila clavipes]|nr:hypothetical protein TNCV_2992121 [Trichonephila clavipes]